SHLVYTDDDRMLEQQNHIFQNLWNNATTQQDKISSLEVGIDLEEVKVVSDPLEIRSTYINLISSANFEISLIIATPKALQRNYRGGIITMLIEAAQKRNVNVNLIIPTYKKNIINEDFFRNKSLATNNKFRMKRSEERRV